MSIFNSPVPRFIVHYTYYFDSKGNGFLAVPMQELHKLGIDSFVSVYSRVSNGLAYLDKDCDLPVFLEARRTIDIPFFIHDLWDGKTTPIKDYSAFEYVS